MAASRRTLARRTFEWAAIRLGTLFLRLLFCTWRVEVRNGEVLEAARRAGEKVVYAFWHNRMLAFVHTHRLQGVTVMVSRHGDGEIIARIIERFGFRTVRGSTTRGGAAALKALIESAAQSDVAVTPDGPRGPRYVLKPGVVLAAARTGRKLVYGTFSAKRAWRFSSWDRFLLPKPFARVIIQVAEPIAFPPALQGASLEEARRDLEARLRRVTAELDREVTGEVDPLLLALPSPQPDPLRAGESEPPS